MLNSASLESEPASCLLRSYIQTLLTSEIRMSRSAHLANIIEKHNRTSSVSVVFVDIEKYSKRRTVNQIAVVDAFTACLREALQQISMSYISYTQANNLNFETDIIKLPTGDGAAIIFSFEGLHDIHLKFARELLRTIDDKNRHSYCEKFASHGWCNCHQNFNLTIGISEGKGIIYTDLNGNYNVAGFVINMAARAMGQADRNQIVLTQEAYTQLIEMDEDATFADKFQAFEVELKHGVQVQVYQYRNQSDSFVNSSPPRDLMHAKRIEEVMNSLRQSGWPMPDQRAFDKIDKDKMLDSMEAFAAQFFSAGELEPMLTKSDIKPMDEL